MPEAERLSLRTRQVLLPELMHVYDPFMQSIGDLYSQYKIQSDSQYEGKESFPRA